MSDRPFRHYQKLINPTTGQPSSGQIYTVLLYAHLGQSDIDAGMVKVRAEIEREWKTRLHLDEEAVRHLSWAIAIMRATDPKEELSHPDIDEEKKLKNAHLRVDEAVAVLRQLTPRLIEFHRTYKSAATGIFERLLSVANEYNTVRRPAWGPERRLRRAWHRDALYLRDVLAERTGHQLSFQKEEAPAVEFISCVLKRTPEAVVKALIR